MINVLYELGVLLPEPPPRYATYGQSKRQHLILKLFLYDLKTLYHCPLSTVIVTYLLIYLNSGCKLCNHILDLRFQFPFGTFVMIGELTQWKLIA